MMERIEAFEKMLADIQRQAEYEKAEMEKLKAAGKEKTATYRQYFGNRMLWNEETDEKRMIHVCAHIPLPQEKNKKKVQTDGKRIERTLSRHALRCAGKVHGN